jgi:hypothetical protein
MHKFAVTSKPPEASGVFNGLLSAVVAGVNNGEYANSLSFADSVITNNPDGAPRGYANANYTVCPRMEQIDPTSALAISSRAAHRRNPVGTVGYTHHHVAIETLSHISSMFAKWVTEFNVLYANASLAQQAINAGSYTRLDSVREARYTDGDVEAFLAAVGPLNDGNISYPASQTIDVDVIYSRVMTQLQSEISILDNLGFSVGEADARRSIGLSTIPKTGQNVCVLSAACYDTLFSAPWRRLLTIPRARDMVREQFTQRLEAALPNIVGDFNVERPYVSITEGDDVLFIPTHLPMNDTGVPITFDSLCAAIDARNTLSMTGQIMPEGNTDVSQTNSGRYGTAPDGGFEDSWLNQFYDKGDLVEAILTGQLSVLDPGLMTVLLSCPIQDPNAPAETILGPVDNTTGALGSYNEITSLVEPISGSIDVISSTVARFTGLDNSMVMHSLPNGLLYIGSCAFAKATSWIRILRELRLNYPQEVKLLMERTGRAKKTLATTPNRLASMDSLLAEVISSGQRDGYINMPALAFNVTRLTRAEQEGPVFAGGQYSAANPGAISVTPQMASECNGWDRVDGSDGRYIITPDGTTVNFEHGTPSRFTGEWDAGRTATWAPDFVADSIALGSGSVEVEVTKNLLSYPYAPIANAGIAPRYVPGSAGLPLAAEEGDTKWDILETVTTVEDYCTILHDQLGEFEGYMEGIVNESYHLTRGFLRGYASILPDSPDYLLNPGNYSPRERGSLDALGRHPAPAQSTGVNGIQTWLAGDFAEATAPYHAYQAAALTAAPVSQWFWDPVRTQAVGRSWHRWAGVMFENILPHPYLPHPVAVPTAYCRLSDLVGLEAPNETNVGAFVTTGDVSSGFAAMGGIGVGMDLAAVRGDASSRDQGCEQGLLPGNPSTMWKAHMSNLVANDITVTAGSNLTGDPGWDVQLGVPDTATVLPVNEMMCLIVNGCARSPSGKSIQTTVLRNLHDAGTSAIAASGLVGNPIPCTFEGETVTAVQNFNGALTPNIGNNQLIVGGKGLLFEGDLYTPNFLDQMAWLVMTYSGEESLIFSHFSGYWAPWDDEHGFISVFSPQVGANYFPNNAPEAQGNVLKPGVTQTGVNLVKNDWFRKIEDLPAKHARMRSGSLANPWVRGISEAGIAHLRYDNSQLGPIFAAIDRAILDLGRQLQSGLTNSLFLEIQMAN